MAEPIAVYGTEHTLTVTVGRQIIATAVASGHGWHITLGRVPHGPKRWDSRIGMYQPVRCHWWAAQSRQQAVDWLRHLGALRLLGRA